MEPGNGRDKLKGRLAGQSFELTTSQLVPVLMLLVGGVAGYLAWQSQDQRLRDLASRQDAMLTHMREQAVLQRQQLRFVLKALETHEWNMMQEPSQRLPLLLSPEVLGGKPSPAE
jgi:hypothetical protein